jgi:predicted  nucleic acid-binding Zn-ribbon protein
MEDMDLVTRIAEIEEQLEVETDPDKRKRLQMELDILRERLRIRRKKMENAPKEVPFEKKVEDPDRKQYPDRGR